MYEDKSPEIAYNFAAFFNGLAEANRSYAGTKLTYGMPGYGIQGGSLPVETMYGEENLGAAMARVPDENLLQSHARRGIVTMVNDGSNSNGSEFLITFDRAPYLDGHNNVVGEVVQGLSVLDQLEADCSRDGKVGAEWEVAAVGQQ